MAELWPIKRVASFFDVHPHTIARWVKLGQFPKPIVKIRNTQRWNSADLKKLISIDTNGYQSPTSEK